MTFEIGETSRGTTVVLIALDFGPATVVGEANVVRSTSEDPLSCPAGHGHVHDHSGSVLRADVTSCVQVCGLSRTGDRVREARRSGWTEHVLTTGTRSIPVCT
jgi:hypothetical protein